ncbi:MULTISPECIES: energy transducer TonB [Butyricimonas]|uniref:energy transducer TonB n=1 Tax=Butyricimonas TaxID=574697 RepID=UPI001D05E92F|nr:MULTISPECIES: energy transducer TonB [Butyricimonas]MCB6974055.1 energy transducer TonB [Butyricimonas synergistica]MCG4520883.1 energy transducer TonB [Butyricimonas sp. DFI.6.44]
MGKRIDFSGLKESLLCWLDEHRHGVMGTVIFHLLVAICLVSMGISQLENHVEMEIELDMPEPEIIQQKQEEIKKKEEVARQSADEEVERMLRSMAVNEDAVKSNEASESHERIEEYINEIQEELRGDYGDRYKAEKNKHFKEDSIRFSRDEKQRLLDSLQSTVYVGKSSVSYNIKGRYKTYLPIPVYKCEFGGKVVVAVVVNRQGRVLKAEVVDKESNQDSNLREVAVDAALRSEFNVDASAPERLAGTITYNFVKQ